jgi:predicted nucleotide-binding protein
MDKAEHPMNKSIAKSDNKNSNKVFIVHGHDDQTKIETARFIERAGLEAIILHEQPRASKTIIEKIESYGDVGFEHGYFIGRLGREKVTALVKEDLETPNDISGVVYTKIDSRGAWKMTLFNELENAGYKVSTLALK